MKSAERNPKKSLPVALALRSSPPEIVNEPPRLASAALVTDARGAEDDEVAVAEVAVASVDEVEVAVELSEFTSASSPLSIEVLVVSVIG